jgi:hypothetical protein
MDIETEEIVSDTTVDFSSVGHLRELDSKRRNLIAKAIDRDVFPKILRRKERPTRSWIPAPLMGYSPDTIQPIESKSIAQVAKRPMNSCLNCDRLQKELNYKLLNLDQSLATMRSQIELESPSILGN